MIVEWNGQKYLVLQEVREYWASVQQPSHFSVQEKIQDGTITTEISEGWKPRTGAYSVSNKTEVQPVPEYDGIIKIDIYEDNYRTSVTIHLNDKVIVHYYSVSCTVCSERLWCCDCKSYEADPEIDDCEPCPYPTIRIDPKYKGLLEKLVQSVSKSSALYRVFKEEVRRDVR